MIPKLIHACWFGGKPLPETHKKYIETRKNAIPILKLKFGQKMIV